MGKRLQKRIEQQRKKMIDLGMSKGFGHPDTILASQELDKLILEAQKQNRQGNDPWHTTQQEGVIAKCLSLKI